MPCGILLSMFLVCQSACLSCSLNGSNGTNKNYTKVSTGVGGRVARPSFNCWDLLRNGWSEYREETSACAVCVYTAFAKLFWPQYRGIKQEALKEAVCLVTDVSFGVSYCSAYAVQVLDSFSTVNCCLLFCLIAASNWFAVEAEHGRLLGGSAWQWLECTPRCSGSLQLCCSQQAVTYPRLASFCSGTSVQWNQSSRMYCVLSLTSPLRC